jgi:hypothetical protein
MTRLLALIAVAVVTGCSGTPEGSVHSSSEKLFVTDFPDIPSDARVVADRLASCAHFAGEINGDGSARDKEVFSIMAKLHCDTINQDVMVVRRKYAGTRAVQRALGAASQF